MILWELAEDHLTNQPEPLLQAVKQALATPGTITIQHAAKNATLGFSGAPLGSYRVEWTSNLVNDVWKTLLTTNVTSSGIVTVQAVDTATNATRFYRVQAP